MLTSVEVGRRALWAAIFLALCLATTGYLAEPAPAFEGRPLFVRVTVLEVENAEGPFDAAVIIRLKHRGDVYIPLETKVGKLSPGKPSKWVDLSEKIDAANDQVTAVVSLEADGQARGVYSGECDSGSPCRADVSARM